MKVALSYDRKSKSHPTRVRGLKLKMERLVQNDIKSHPTRVRGLKRSKM